MSSARVSSSALADTETLLNLLQRKSSVRPDVQRPPDSSESGHGFVPASGALADQNAYGSVGKYSISSETMAFLLTVQQTAGEATGRVAGGAAASRAAASGQAGAASAAGQDSEEARVEQLFRAIDTDGDGRVGRSEFVSFIEERGGSTSFAVRMFEKIDAADTGFVTRDRMAAAVRQSLSSVAAETPATEPVSAAAADRPGGTQAPEGVEPIGPARGGSGFTLSA
ncbi:EF-hand domain-containing protein [Rhodoplanes roseus]|uniref:EF-hand domain-containing protein n=1 Tax=Rhodoplanes roseus TaxID=29409 RepID=A0A327KY40_9BRAD|nr:EF-hand domain-containing protein [Rhodoplanes roseus]RAI42495.1 hypothetical protein CH341_19240 [Rhodoplanes roseus]